MIGVSEFFYKRTEAVVVIEFIEFKKLVDTNGGDGTESVVLFEFGDTVLETIFLDFLPEFNTGVVGRSGGGLSGGSFFLRLSEDESKDGAGDRVNRVLGLGDTNMSVVRVLG